MKSVMITLIYLEKSKIITKNAQKRYYKRKDNQIRDSINDDLESLFGDVRLGKEPKETVGTHFLPMVTDKEPLLGTNHCLESLFGDHLILIKRSSYFYQGKGRRKTFSIKYDNSEIVSQKYRESRDTLSQNIIENSAEDSFENLSENSQNIGNCCFLQ